MDDTPGYLLRTQREEYDKRIQSLEAALREIAEHRHLVDGVCDTYSELNDDQHYGCMVGHRCAAEIARKALK